MTDAPRRGAVAERAARAGGAVARETFREQLAVETKTDKNDLVTRADKDTQRRVIAAIRREFPDAAIVGEEESLPAGVDDDVLLERVPESGPAWVVDPIDGTTNYVRGIRFWATSVAAVVDGSLVGAATHLPAEGDTYAAGPETATHNGTTVSVSDRTDTETFVVGHTGWWPRRNEPASRALFRGSADRFGDVRRLGCMQGTLALLAAGSLDAVFMPATPNPWDALSGVALTRRAGGTVTDVRGEPWSNGAPGLVASNGEAHDVVLEAVRDAVEADA